MEDKLNSKAYQTVSQRMQAEEATCQLSMTDADGEEECVYLTSINKPYDINCFSNKFF